MDCPKPFCACRWWGTMVHVCISSARLPHHRYRRTCHTSFLSDCARRRRATPTHTDRPATSRVIEKNQRIERRSRNGTTTNAPCSTHLAVLLLLLARWGHRPSHVHPTIRIFRLLLRRLQNLRKHRTSAQTYRQKDNHPLGKNTAMFRPRSSWPPRCRIHHNSLAPRTTSPDVVSRKIRIRLLQPTKRNQCVCHENGLHKGLPDVLYK